MVLGDLSVAIVKGPCWCTRFGDPLFRVEKDQLLENTWSLHGSRESYTLCGVPGLVGSAGSTRVVGFKLILVLYDLIPRTL